MPDKLPLHEQLMLLMLRDETGTMESHTHMHRLALGAHAPPCAGRIAPL